VDSTAFDIREYHYIKQLKPKPKHCSLVVAQQTCDPKATFVRK